MYTAQYVYGELANKRFCMVVVEVNQRATQDLDFSLFGTRQHSVLVILKKLLLLGGFDPITAFFHNQRRSH